MGVAGFVFGVGLPGSGEFGAVRPGFAGTVGVGLVGILLAYEHWLIRPDDLTRVNQAFFQVNGIISLGLFLVVLLQLVFNS